MMFRENLTVNRATRAGKSQRGTRYPRLVAEASRVSTPAAGQGGGTPAWRLAGSARGLRPLPIKDKFGKHGRAAERVNMYPVPGLSLTFFA